MIILCGRYTYFSSIDECDFDESEAFRFFVDTTGAAAAAAAAAPPAAELVAPDNLLSFTNEPPSGNPLPLMSAEAAEFPSEYAYLLPVSLPVACCRTDGARIDEFIVALLPPEDDLSDPRPWSIFN